MFNPDFELSWDFGKDSEVIMEMIYLIENFDLVRFEILSHYLKFKARNSKIIGDCLSSLNSKMED